MSDAYEQCLSDLREEDAAKRVADAYTRGWNDALKAAGQSVPMNWTDNLLTGDEGIGQPPYDCSDVERVLRGTQDRIRALTPKPSQESGL